MKPRSDITRSTKTGVLDFWWCLPWVSLIPLFCTSGDVCKTWISLIPLFWTSGYVSPRSHWYPCFGFWWCLPWISKPWWILCLPTLFPVCNGFLRFTSDATPVDCLHGFYILFLTEFPDFSLTFPEFSRFFQTHLNNKYVFFKWL